MFKKSIYFHIAVVYFVFIANCFAVSDLPYKEGELLVRFAPKTDGKQIMATEQNQVLTSIGGGTVKRSFKIVPGLTLVKLPENSSVEKALPSFRTSGKFLYALPNYRAKVLLNTPNDTYFNDLWGMHNTGQTGGTPDADIDAPEAWDIHTDASNTIVAVIDSGVDYTHPDLAANIWTNETELNGITGYDDDGNGYIDDIYGYDFANDDDDPLDDYGHGTHCAGTIGAVGNNGVGVAGVCWSTKIMALKWIDAYGYGDIADAISCIDYAVDKGVKILSNSWHWPPGDYPPLREAIEAAAAEGVLFVVAAGNSGSDNDVYPDYPSSYECSNIISVMATDQCDVRSIWPEYPASSSYGATSVDLGAPGTDILSCIPGGYYDYYDGTSMATPHVAGACALIWSMYPHLTAVQVKQIILDSADRLDSLDNLCVSEGRLNLHQALLHAHPLDMEIQDDIADPDGCVIPDDEITFNITYGNPTVTNPADPNYWGPAYDTQIHFPLPDEVDYTNTSDPNYSIYGRTYVWNIGTINPGDSSSVSLTVNVNQNAEPVGKIRSKVKMYSSIGYGEADEETRICCWGGDRIYVNAYANGYETGQSWPNAYKDLQQAMERAQKSCGNQIWVAHGIYTPTKARNQNVSFDMVNGLKLYGGFTGSEDVLENRDFVSYPTYLSGNIDLGGDEDSYVVVNTAPGSTGDTVIDGFVITHSTVAGIKCNQADLTIQNCVITDNDANGINLYQSSPLILDSIITNNGAVGVYDCNESDVMIDRCIISQNGAAGVYCTKNAKASVTSTWIHNNQLDGITFSNAASGSLVRNNTIVYNTRNGVAVVQGSSPAITNCIVWDNAAGDFLGCNATYSCFDYGYQGLGNINYDPYFAYSDPSSYNYHLHPDSPCKNAGNPLLSYDNQFDIDGEGRISGTYVDIGADEIDQDCSDVYNLHDWNADGVVNIVEFNAFSQAWLSRDPNDPSPPTDPNDFPGWDSRCDLNSDYNVNLPDLIIFVEDTPWLWTACWRRTDKWLFTFGNVQSDTDDMQQSMMLLNQPAPETSMQAESLMVESLPAEAEIMDLPAEPETAEPQIAETQVVVELPDLSAVAEKSVAEQIADLQDSIQFLEEIWLEDEQIQQEIQPDDWQAFMDEVYKTLTELEQTDR